MFVMAEKIVMSDSVAMSVMYPMMHFVKTNAKSNEFPQYLSSLYIHVRSDDKLAFVWTDMKSLFSTFAPLTAIDDEAEANYRYLMQNNKSWNGVSINKEAYNRLLSKGVVIKKDDCKKLVSIMSERSKATVAWGIDIELDDSGVEFDVKNLIIDNNINKMRFSIVNSKFPDYLPILNASIEADGSLKDKKQDWDEMDEADLKVALANPFMIDMKYLKKLMGSFPDLSSTSHHEVSMFRDPIHSHLHIYNSYCHHVIGGKETQNKSLPNAPSKINICNIFGEESKASIEERRHQAWTRARECDPELYRYMPHLPGFTEEDPTEWIENVDRMIWEWQNDCFIPPVIEDEADAETEQQEHDVATEVTAEDDEGDETEEEVAVEPDRDDDEPADRPWDDGDDEDDESVEDEADEDEVADECDEDEDVPVIDLPNSDDYVDEDEDADEDEDEGEGVDIPEDTLEIQLEAIQRMIDSGAMTPRDGAIAKARLRLKARAA